MLHQVLKLYWFCCCFIAISIPVLPCTILAQFLAFHTVATQSCFLPFFARMHHFAKAVIYLTGELLKRIPFALIYFVRYKPFAVKRFLFAYLYFYISCITCFTLHSQWLVFKTILLSGDIETNPGPETLDFCCWNLNSITAHDFLRVSLIEAYNSVYNYDLIGVVETHLDNNVVEDRMALDGYSFIKNNHPQNVKRGGVGLYYKDSLPLKNRSDLVTLPECVVCEIQINKKKYFFVVIYRSPSQSQSEFDNFTINFELLLSKMHAENPFCIVITGDFNCRSTQWWEHDIENNEGKIFEPFVSELGLHQLISEPTHFMGDSKSCIVVPVHKKHEKNLKYRPISLLPIFGKILEKLMYDSICSHLVSYDLLNPNQSGFRPGDSTINQLISITHTIFKAFDCNPPLDVRSVYLDISKAFDRVWHDGLMYKLKRCGVSGQLLVLIPSFLKDRKQRTVLNGKNSNWGDISAGVPQGSILGPLFFLVYINDLSADLKCNVKLFADDTSLFTVVKDPNTAACDMNHDLDRIKQWAYDWRMSFNPDPLKQAVEIRFTRRKSDIDHPVILFNNTPVKKVDEHKHLGIILDSKLTFSAHIKAVISKTRKGIGMLKYLSSYLPRHTLNELYKLYVRPHLDYGDVIYHIPGKMCDFSQNITLSSLMEKLESVQYSAALAVTGTWRGSSREKLYAELGWESLNLRRWSRRLILFYKIINDLTPEYTRAPIPPLHQSQYCFRNQDVIGRIRARTEKFESSFYPNCLNEWNQLDPEIRLAPSLSTFKTKLLTIIRPPAKSVFGIHDPLGLSYLTQLRVGLSKLNCHKFNHNFRDTINPMCPTNDGIEDTEHFLLLCPSFVMHRRDLLTNVLSLVRPFGYISLSNKDLIQLLLFGGKDLTNELNRKIIELTLHYINNTGRFD